MNQLRVNPIKPAAVHENHKNNCQVYIDTSIDTTMIIPLATVMLVHTRSSILRICLPVEFEYHFDVCLSFRQSI